MNELIFLLLLFGLPAVIGFQMARRRGKNPVVWGLLSCICPFFLVILHLQYKRLDKKVDPPPEK